MDRWTNIAWRTDGGGTIRQFAYSYNAAGMITNVVREDGGHTEYSYDDLDRLTEERVYDRNNTLTADRAWDYDLAGNRTYSVENGTSNSYTLGIGDRLASWGTNAENTVQYDPAGNVTNMTFGDGRTVSLSWNARYQVTAAATNGTEIERYGYDALGRRIFCSTRSASGSWETNFFVYDGPHVIADLDGTGGVIRTYAWGPGIDNLLAITLHGGPGAPRTVYAVKDHLGTVHALVDTSGAVVERYEYDAWGRILGVFDSSGQQSKVNGLWSSSIGNRYLFQGREYSWAAGLYYFRARWYDPVTGRWMSCDPIGISGGLNQYGCLQTDPSELCGSTWACARRQLLNT